MTNVLLSKNKQEVLLGNEAIVRGSIEAGVQFVAVYPGTPSSEIGDLFFALQNSKDKIQNLHFEYSVNEKVALEAGIGASFAGAKTLIAMKSFGINVASDSLFPFVYTGTKGATVILVTDDPSCYSSAETEQDSRGFAYLARIPILEPSSVQECKDFTKLAFEISEKFNIPVILRTVTRASHQRGAVNLMPIQKIVRTTGFVKDKKRFTTLPPTTLDKKAILIKKIEKIKEYAEKSTLNRIFNSLNNSPKNLDSEIGIITSGPSYFYALEVAQNYNLNLQILKLGFFYPLPEQKISDFIKNLKTIIITEDIDDYIQKEVERIAKKANPKIKIIGKEFQIVGETSPEYVQLLLAKSGLIELKEEYKTEKKKIIGTKIQKRFPQLCRGCPYHIVIGLIKKLAPKETIWGGDIGCYMLFGYSGDQDYLLSMGSGLSIAHGIKKASPKEKIISFMGEGTFFHSGITALINTVYNKSNPLFIILDNSTTAMTGGQPTPGTNGDNPIKIENIVKACGVKNLEIINPYEVRKFEEAFKDLLAKKEVAVLIIRSPCMRIKK